MRAKKLYATIVCAFTLVALLVCGGCSGTEEVRDEGSEYEESCVLIYGRHANSQADPTLLGSAIEDVVSSQGTLSLILLDGSPQLVGKQKYAIESRNRTRVESEIAGKVEEAQGVISSDALVAQVPEVDVLGALELAGRELSTASADKVSSGRNIVVISDPGFSTAGSLNFLEIGLTADADEFLAWAEEEGRLPDLSSIDEIRWYCFGDVAAPQDKPSPGMIRSMKNLYESVLRASGFAGDLIWEEAVPGPALPADGLPEVSVVEMPEPSTFVGAKIELRDDSGIYFLPDEADFVDLDVASRALAQYAAELADHPDLTVHVTGFTAHAGGNTRHGDGELELLRAEAVKSVLVDGGARDYQVVVEEGGEGPYEYEEGASDEERAETDRKNRFVELRFAEE
ncbi:OmpA family protein [Adlercreutzia aquisgranensis]|uniref:OmpA family protein n=1 Tax=Adlercreutzia aquisgranensis TaxID=2941323 RepID=UPI00203C1A8B|nr:OmpA family protein [Adlercreutzia aquisgranensis]